jgi:hypothetical protein
MGKLLVRHRAVTVNQFAHTANAVSDVNVFSNNSSMKKQRQKIYVSLSIILD